MTPNQVVLTFLSLSSTWTFFLHFRLHTCLRTGTVHNSSHRFLNFIHQRKFSLLSSKLQAFHPDKPGPISRGLISRGLISQEPQRTHIAIRPPFFGNTLKFADPESQKLVFRFHPNPSVFQKISPSISLSRSLTLSASCAHLVKSNLTQSATELKE